MTSSRLASKANCWLVVEVECPSVEFALSFPLPASFADLVDVVTSRCLTLLCGDCLAWLREAASRAELVEVEGLQPVLEASLALTLDVGGCDRLALYLLAWGLSQQENETRY